MENINDHKGGIRKFSVSPRLAKLKADFEASGGKFENWKLGDIFSVNSPVKKFNANAVKFGNKHPYVVRTSQNNGVRAYLDEDEKYLNEANTISFGQDTATMFYQEKPYFTGDKIKIMKFKHGELTSLISCYLLASMGRSFSLFSWGTSSFNENVLNSVLINVPTKSSYLAYNYMEQYISVLEEEKMLQIDKFLKDSGLNETTLTAEEANALEKFRKGEVKFREWKIGELFEKHELKIINPNFNKKTDLSSHCDKEHSIPVTNAKLGDNGIMFWGKPNDFKTQSMSIDIVQNGAVATGKVYPQPQQTGVLWDSYLIGLTNHTATNELLFFFSTVLEKSIRKKYYYENKAYWKLVREDEIVVPVTICGTVDYAFMQHFISALEKLIMRPVVEMAEKKPEEYQHGYSVTCMAAEASHYEGL